MGSGNRRQTIRAVVEQSGKNVFPNHFLTLMEKHCEFKEKCEGQFRIDSHTRLCDIFRTYLQYSETILSKTDYSTKSFLMVVDNAVCFDVTFLDIVSLVTYKSVQHTAELYKSGSS